MAIRGPDKESERTNKYPYLVRQLNKNTYRQKT